MKHKKNFNTTFLIKEIIINASKTKKKQNQNKVNCVEKRNINTALMADKLTEISAN